ncbi:hypothetical protein KGA66_21460 [Actinocrinis puniceicyclus]|uniref:Uncharacterized protein n=1 Tax=Actinocrinis puniceicyclus TaxID=977794 RepID=A0A8J8BDU3_9ACTN|nr:hypothetical protein [Actinocrinis puniceicyclus]MBS2965633.1 hypothetical protein [Actinocrinis puniceicyclus]
MAERIEQSLSRDAGKAIENMYREAGKRTEDVVKRVTQADEEQARKLLEVAEHLGRTDAAKTTSAAEKQAQAATRSTLRRQFSQVLDPGGQIRDLAPLKGTGPELPGIRDPGAFDPQSLRGLSAEKIERGVPGHWVAAESKSGGGKVFRDPGNFGRQLRTMPGYAAGNRPDPLTHGPYAEVCQNGITTKVPLEGNPTLGGTP